MSASAIPKNDDPEIFSTADQARAYLEALRWQGNPACPYCHTHCRIQTRKREGYFRCLACREDFTVRTGTAFARSHVPLHKWLRAVVLYADSGGQIPSSLLSKELGITQKSAWSLLRRLREARGLGDAVNSRDGSSLLKRILAAGGERIVGDKLDKENLLGLASKYVWWKSADEAIKHPQSVIAMVMDRGTIEDIQLLGNIIGEDGLRAALAKAEPGQFRPQSWTYWHFKLNGLFESTLPEMPTRAFA
ncbi:MAG TPA: IS1595 family transposase [Rectinemataceae bacterium]|nr:IS1595 family transposase [Rectinemataceae bacterium]